MNAGAQIAAHAVTDDELVVQCRLLCMHGLAVDLPAHAAIEHAPIQAHEQFMLTRCGLNPTGAAEKAPFLADEAGEEPRCEQFEKSISDALVRKARENEDAYELSRKHGARIVYVELHEHVFHTQAAAVHLSG